MKLALLIVEALSLIIGLCGCNGPTAPSDMRPVVAVEMAYAIQAQGTDVTPAPHVRCGGTGFITHGDGHRTPCPGCEDCKTGAYADPICQCGTDCKCATTPNNPACACEKCRCDHAAPAPPEEPETAEHSESYVDELPPLTAAELDRAIATASDPKIKASLQKMRDNWFNPDGTLKPDDAPMSHFQPVPEPIGEGREAPGPFTGIVWVMDNGPCVHCVNQEKVLAAMPAWHDQFRVVHEGEQQSMGLPTPHGYPAAFVLIEGKPVRMHVGFLKAGEIADLNAGQPLGSHAAKARPVMRYRSTFCESCR